MARTRELVADDGRTQTSATLTDRDLVMAVGEGSQAAFGALYDRYAALALGVASRVVHDRGIAEEVVQDAFLALWRRAGSYHADRGEPRSWLLSIVTHRAIDYVRRSGHADVELTEAMLPTPDGDVWLQTARQLDREAIASSLAELPREQREPIELAFVAGLTHAEIAARTSLPLGTVKGRVRLGLARLRRHLEMSGAAPLSATSAA
jgi:RNA polymerase sigma-70 factor (ECF subfamily)